MQIEEVLEELVRGRNVIFSHSANTLIKIASLVSKFLLDKGVNIVIMDEKGHASRYIPIELLDKVTITNDMEEACGIKTGLLIVLANKSFYKLRNCASENILILTKPTNVFKSMEYTKYYITPIPGSKEYVLKSHDRALYTRLKLDSGYIGILEAPPGIYGKAYEVLINSLSMYGEITMKDATTVISKELGLDKKHARNILIKLARRRYIRVVKGKISLC